MSTPASASDKGHVDRRLRGGFARYSLVTLVALALGAWAAWMAVAETPDVEGTLRSATVHSDHAVTVYFEVAKDRQQPARCTVRVLGLDGFPVGRETVTIPATTERARFSRRLTTSTHAASAQIVNCHFVGAG